MVGVLHAIADGALVSTLKSRIYLSYRQQVPPYACFFVFSIVSVYFCNKHKNRSVMATICALIAAAGYAMFLGASHCLSCWLKNNVRSTFVFYLLRIRQQKHELWRALSTDYW